jgi:multisubunit Na+/H+ antiporter MnhB subunit
MENLALIDWKMVGFSALWITGLAVILSTIGFADYHASVEKDRFRGVIQRPGYRAAIDAGLILFSLGLSGSARSPLETVLWLLFAVIFSYFTVRAWRERAASLAQAKGAHEEEKAPQEDDT